MNHWGKDFHSKKKNANFLLDKIHLVRREAIFQDNRSTITIKVRWVLCVVDTRFAPEISYNKARRIGAVQRRNSAKCIPGSMVENR